ncbi:hypothetical protein ACC687_39090, partial [Rhizobium ruizarguesonis]
AFCKILGEKACIDVAVIGGGTIDTGKFAGQLQQALKGRADLLLMQNIPLEWRGRESQLKGLPMVQNQNHAYQLPFLPAFEDKLKKLNAK